MAGFGVKFPVAVCAAAVSLCGFGAAYEIGEEFASESFWKSDPVLFVRRHADSGFEFTSEQRDGADSRQDGGVTCFGLPVYESRISFGQAGGVERVELMLFARGGTETFKVITAPDGTKFRRRVRLDKSITREEFAAALDTVRGRLTASGKKQPAIVKESAGAEYNMNYAVFDYDNTTVMQDVELAVMGWQLENLRLRFTPEEVWGLFAPQIPDLDYSFSGLKTSILYTVRDNLKLNPNFIEENKADLCASVQKTIIDILMNKLVKASKQTGIKTVAIAGGVSANSGLHDAMLRLGEKYHWKVFIPRLSYSTDNAAMVAVAGYFKYLRGEFASQDLVPYARQSLKE